MIREDWFSDSMEASHGWLTHDEWSRTSKRVKAILRVYYKLLKAEEMIDLPVVTFFVPSLNTSGQVVRQETDGRKGTSAESERKTTVNLHKIEVLKNRLIEEVKRQRKEDPGIGIFIGLTVNCSCCGDYVDSTSHAYGYPSEIIQKVDELFEQESNVGRAKRDAKESNGGTKNIA